MLTYGDNFGPEGTEWLPGASYDSNGDLRFECWGDPFAMWYSDDYEAGISVEVEFEIATLPEGARVEVRLVNPEISPLVFDTVGVHRAYFTPGNAFGYTLNMRGAGDVDGVGVVKNSVKVRHIICSE